MNPHDAYNQMDDIREVDVEITCTCASGAYCLACMHGLNCHCVECIPFDHNTLNGHEVECFCDLCGSDSAPIGFTSCTCDGCDIEGEAQHCWNIKSDERIVANVRRVHGDDCTCWLCASIRPVYIHGDDGHWLECKCRDCVDGGRDVDHCTCPKCDIAPERGIPESIAIVSIKTIRRVIEIHKESYGYSTTAISLTDNAISETTFCLDQKEAEEEMMRYMREDEPRAIPPPELQKKLEPIEYKSEDEGDMPDIDAIVDEHIVGGQYRITNIHHGHHLYTVNVVRLVDMLEVDGSFVQSPGQADDEFLRYINKYR